MNLRSIFSRESNGTSEQDKAEAPDDTLANRSIPPIFCLSLPEEPWKRTKSAEHFSSRGISPVFIDGLHGTTLGLKPTNPYDYEVGGQPRYMHPSQIGCVLSHRMALSVALASGASEFIVCEEDVILPDNFVGLFLSIRASLPDDAEVMQLEYLASDGQDWEPVNTRVKKIRYPFCSACIWWSRSGAKKAISMIKPVDRPYDIMLIHRVFPFLNHYVPLFPIASQRSRGDSWTSTMGDAPREDGTLIAH